tara:strand:+ start:282 stop:554 length:273 start_codon:yes stop_codon:yes gene_type:complete
MVCDSCLLKTKRVITPEVKQKPMSMVDTKHEELKQPAAPKFKGSANVKSSINETIDFSSEPLYEKLQETSILGNNNQREKSGINMQIKSK